MYVWVILATFLAMLASYTLAPRSDMRKITVEPLAEAELGKFLVQQRAAYSYVELHKPPFSGHKVLNNYSSGIIDQGTLRSYLPFGHVLSGDYTSQVFCMNETMTTELASGTNGPCNEKKSRKVLVTYGLIPERWLNLGTDIEQPNADFMNTIRTISRSGETVGYTMIDSAASEDPVQNPSGSQIVIYDGRRLENEYIPEAVLKNPNYKRVCDMEQNFVCLVGMTSI